jgi:hypothetical protein
MPDSIVQKALLDLVMQEDCLHALQYLNLQFGTDRIDVRACVWCNCWTRMNRVHNGYIGYCCKPVVLPALFWEHVESLALLAPKATKKHSHTTPLLPWAIAD